MKLWNDVKGTPFIDSYPHKTFIRIHIHSL